MPFEYVTLLSGETVPEEDIDRAAVGVINAIMSELPEESRTYDAALYVIRRAKEKLKGSKVAL